MEARHRAASSESNNRDERRLRRFTQGEAALTEPGTKMALYTRGILMEGDFVAVRSTQKQRTADYALDTVCGMGYGWCSVTGLAT
jgi:hypothetical protein